MATQYGFGKVVTDGLVLALDAADRNSYVSGSATWFDVSGNNYHGTIYNNPTYSLNNGGTIRFNGTNNYASSSVINLFNSGTISLWFNRSGNGTPDAGGVVDLFANVSSNGQFGWSAGLNVSSSKLDFYIGNSGSLGVENFSTASISSNVWYNAVFTYNGATKTIYVNGIQDSSYASTVNGSNTSDRWGLASRVSAPRYFQGQIANAYLYNRALSAAEVLQNFLAQKARFGVELPGPPFIAPLLPGLYKTEYSGYFNDNVAFFATATVTSASVQQSPIEDTSTSLRDNFSIQWLGYFIPSTTETYTFFITSDDASYIWVGPNALSGSTTANATVNNGGTHGVIEQSGTAALTAGVAYPVRIQFGEQGGGNAFTLFVSTPTIPKSTNVSGLVFYNPGTNGF